MKVGTCFKTSCLYKNESETAICSRIYCPLMEKNNVEKAEALGVPDVPARSLESTGSSGCGAEARTEETPKRES